MSNPVVVGVGLVSLAILAVVVLCGAGGFLVHLWNEGKKDGTTWRLGIVLFVIFSIAEACFSKS